MLIQNTIELVYMYLMLHCFCCGLCNTRFDFRICPQVMFGSIYSILSGHLKMDKTKVLMENGSLMKVESIAECSKGSILQYFRPALSDNLS